MTRPPLLTLDFGLFDYEIHLYGLVYALAFASALLLIRFDRYRRVAWNVIWPNAVTTIVVAGYPASILSKRLLYGDTPAAAGTHMLGWSLGAAAGLWLYARLRGVRPSELFDSIGTVLLLGSAMGRLACFAAGCCHGIPWPAPLGMHFDGAGAATYFPAQLLNAACDFVSFAIVYFWVRPRCNYPGRTAVWCVMLYACCRFPVEFVRTEPRLAAGLTPAQWISLSLVLLMLALRTRLRQDVSVAPIAELERC